MWLSNNTPFKTGVALRGGVPICWPRFGPAAQQGLPSHGFARNLPWALKAHNEDDNGVMLTFELQSSEATGNTGRTISRCWHVLKWAKPVKLNWKRMASLQPHPRSTAILTLATSPTLRSADSAIGLLIKLTTLKKVSRRRYTNLSDRTDRVYLNPEACSVIHDATLNRTIDVVTTITLTS